MSRDDSDAPVDLMLIVPHPDDEVFGLGGALLRAAGEGRRTAVLTLTRGGAGRSLGLAPQVEVPRLREEELRGSVTELGVSELIVKSHDDYVTSADRGLAPRPGLRGVDAGELAAEVGRELDRLRPRVLVTFGPNGSNGHPDHVATSEAVSRALDEGASAPERLYWYASETPFDGPERTGFLAPEAIRAAHVPPTHRLELTREELEGKLRAMAHHRSQALSVLNFMQNVTYRLFVETFHRVRPEPAPGGPRTVRAL